MIPALRHSRSIVGAFLMLAGTGCSPVVSGFGRTPTAAAVNAEDFFASIAERLTNVQRSPRFFAARSKLGKSALTPSVIYNDTSIWTVMGPENARTLDVDGDYGPNRYAFTEQWGPAKIEKRADAQHIIRLRKLSASEFEWFAQVDFAIGRITAAEFAFLINRILASTEQRRPSAIRQDYRTNFPRTTAAWGKLFTLDSLSTLTDAEGATTTRVSVRITPAKIGRSMASFASYLTKYVSPAEYRLTLTDARGGRWFEMQGNDNLTTLRVRSRGGLIAPLNGPVRQIPDTLQIRMDFRTRVLLFTVGFRNLIGTMFVLQSPRERAWVFRFQREPEWRLPPAVGYMLRTPLRRPFAGAGSVFRIGVRDTPGGQTVVTRTTVGVVQESAILRFLNRLSGTMMGDFVGKSEAEENRFGAEAFNAMRYDTRAVLR